MMRSFDLEELRASLAVHPRPIAGMIDTEFEWGLGTVTISKLHPQFRVGFGHKLQSDSGFYKVGFDFGPELRGSAAVFRAFDPMAGHAPPAEYVVGWVPPARERDLDEWIAFLNTEIAKRLASNAVVPGKKLVMRVGGFKELGYNDAPDAPSIVEARGKRLLEFKKEVVGYLRSGRGFVVSPGLDTDVFDSTKTSDSPTVMTDGTYAWPRLLAYYVEQYDVRLPAHFEAHMRANGWRVPEGIDLGALKLGQYHDD
jgi:hypothetical protein